jgi:hypothetical protein
MQVSLRSLNSEYEDKTFLTNRIKLENEQNKRRIKNVCSKVDSAKVRKR